MMDISSDSVKDAVWWKSLVFVILGIILLLFGGATRSDLFVLVFDVSSGFILTLTGLLGIAATKNPQYVSTFLVLLYIQSAFISIAYAFSVGAVAVMAIAFPSCGTESSSSCKNEQGIAVLVMVVYSVASFGLFFVVLFLTYAIRDSRKLQARNSLYYYQPIYN